MLVNEAIIAGKETVAAPKIHGEKLGDRAASGARRVCYWRMHDLMRSGGVDCETDWVI